MRWDFNSEQDWTKFKGTGYTMHRIGRYSSSAQFIFDARQIVNGNATHNGNAWAPTMFEGFSDQYAIGKLDNYYYDIAMNNFEAKVETGHTHVSLEVVVNPQRNFLVLSSDQPSITVWSWWLTTALYDQAKYLRKPLNKWD